MYAFARRDECYEAKCVSCCIVYSILFASVSAVTRKIRDELLRALLLSFRRSRSSSGNVVRCQRHIVHLDTYIDCTSPLVSSDMQRIITERCY